MKRWFLLAVVLLGVLTGCSGKEKGNTAVSPVPAGWTESEDLSVSGASAIESLVKRMTLEEKIYQMFFVTPESITGVQTAVQAGQATKMALSEQPVGGIIYFAKNIQTPEQTKKMIANSQEYSEIPLFIGVDEEGGTVSRIGKNQAMGVRHFPNMEEIGASGDSQQSYEVGKTIGSQIKELGFNMDFAPDADVLINPENTEIGARSFGDDPQLVAEMVKAQIRGFHDAGIAAAAKHFPGHGSTAQDSHKGFSKSARTEQELFTAEFVPFQAAIAEQVDFILISHMALTQIEPSGIPASLSEKIISGYLKDTLGFSGIAITDSLSMGAVTQNYEDGEAAVLAVKAGADMLLMPPDVKAAHTAVCDAVKKGEISQNRIDDSVRRILEIKNRYGLIKE